MKSVFLFVLSLHSINVWVMDIFLVVFNYWYFHIARGYVR